jgi:hypothetical protein
VRHSQCVPHLNLQGCLHVLFTGKPVTPFLCALLACLSIALAACGGQPATTHQLTTHRSAPPHLAPTPTKAPTPTPKPTPTPTPTPQPQPVATQPPPVATQPPPGPAILDVAPASMSIVGHLDCSKTASAYFCQAAVISGAGNRASLSWTAFANIGGVGFSPAQGSLAPGTRVVLTISIPVGECAGTFFFRGPVNTHTISWQC